MVEEISDRIFNRHGELMRNLLRERAGFLTIFQVELLHQKLISRFGGAVGVRNKALVESAIYKEPRRQQRGIEGGFLFAARTRTTSCPGYPKEGTRARRSRATIQAEASFGEFNPID
jgi:hypothetical protein